MNTKINKAIAIVTVAFSLTVSSITYSQTETSPKDAGVNKAPKWTLETQDGKQVSFSDYKGQPVMLHIWGTWCPYCKKLQPGLQKIHENYKDRGLIVLGISVNEPITAKPQTELESRGIDFLTLIEGDEVAINDFQVMGTPTTIFISAEGNIVGSTMVSDPTDPRFTQVAEYLVNNI